METELDYLMEGKEEVELCIKLRSLGVSRNELFFINSKIPFYLSAPPQKKKRDLLEMCLVVDQERKKWESLGIAWAKSNLGRVLYGYLVIYKYPHCTDHSKPLLVVPK